MRFGGRIAGTGRSTSVVALPGGAVPSEREQSSPKSNFLSKVDFTLAIVGA